MTAEVCRAQDKRQSSVKPRCLCVVTCVIGVALIDTSKDGMERLVVKSIKADLLLFTVRAQEENHADN